MVRPALAFSEPETIKAKTRPIATIERAIWASKIWGLRLCLDHLALLPHIGEQLRRLAVASILHTRISASMHGDQLATLLPAHRPKRYASNAIVAMSMPILIAGTMWRFHQFAFGKTSETVQAKSASFLHAHPSECRYRQDADRLPEP